MKINFAPDPLDYSCRLIVPHVINFVLRPIRDVITTISFSLKRHNYDVIEMHAIDGFACLSRSFAS